MNKNIVISKDDFFAYFFLLIISVRNSLVYTELQIFGNADKVFVLVETLVFGLCFLLRKKYSFKYLVLISLFVLIALITFWKTGFMNFYSMLMVAIIFTDIDYSSAFRFLFRIRLVMLGFVVLLSLIGVIDINQRYVSKSMVINSDLGYGLGYTHPNRLAYAFLLLILLNVAIHYRAIIKATYVYSIMLTAIGYLVTKSRTLVVCSAILLLLLFFFNTEMFKKSKKRLVNMLIVSVIPFCVITGVIIPMIMYNVPVTLQEILVKIDILISGRFTHTYRAFLTYPITLFGGRDDFSKMQDLYNYSTVDNGYARLLFSLGVFGFVVYVLLSILAIIKLLKNQQYVFLALIMTVSIWGISENILSSFAFNIVVIFWCELLKKKETLDVVLDYKQSQKIAY